MGCDIHTFIEYTDFNDHSTGEPYWQCFGGQIDQGRNYTMFGLLAGVRGGEALFDPRGLPEGKHSYQVEDYMHIRIDEEEDAKNTEGYTSLAKARSWGNPIEERNGKPWRVRSPDLHSHSWLTLSELQTVLARYTLGDNPPEIDVPLKDRAVVIQAVAALRGGGEMYGSSWSATLAAMEAFAAHGAQTRLVFCFDN